MPKSMTIINLACTITKLRKWGQAWKHSAESAQNAASRLTAEHERKLAEHRASFGARTEADRKIIEGLRTDVEDLRNRLNSLVTVVGVRTVYDCQGDGAEYPIGHSESELKARYADHDTPAGKEAANSQMTEIKVGDVVEVVSASGGQTWMADVGSTGKVRRFELIDSIECVRLQNLPGKRNALGGYVSLCDVRKVPQ